MRRPFVNIVGRTWFKRYQPHRLVGPAVERVNGAKEWFDMGVRHRIDGPAIENENSHVDLSWWVYGVRLVDCDREDKFGAALRITMTRMLEEYRARR